MKRLLWLGIGIAVGVVVVRQVTKAAGAYSPSQVASSARDSVAGLWDSVRDFMADVRQGMAEREAEIAYAIEHGVSLADLDASRGDDDAAGRVQPPTGPAASS